MHAKITSYVLYIDKSSNFPNIEPAVTVSRDTTVSINAPIISSHVSCDLYLSKMVSLVILLPCVLACVSAVELEDIADVSYAQ